MKSKVPILALTGILLLVAIFLASPAQAATSELFFSEYIEGSSNNKALEIYNGTGASVDLAAGGYSIQMFFNGSTSAALTINLTGTVADGDVYVVANSGANATILAQADQTNGAGWYNGDDAVVLRKGTTIIDSVGQVGFDPGSEWGTGLTSTADNTLQRMSAVCAGDPDATNAFDPSVEWNGFATDTFDGLGAHTADCNGGPVIPPIVINEIMQNPAAVADSAGEWFELYNAGTSDVDVNGWTIKDNDTDIHVINNGGPLVIPAGGYLVLGINSDSGVNGEVTVNYQYSNFFLGNSADEVVLVDGNAAEVDRVEYDNGATFPDPNGASMSLKNPSLDNNIGVNWCGVSLPFGAGDLGTPGTANICVTGQAAKIHEVQGSGPNVAITAPVNVEAIVIADFQLDDQLRGFFIQEEDGDVDADPATSEGIFVFCSSCGVDVAVGDKVKVAGIPGDFFGMSQIDATGGDGLVLVLSGGNVLPTASTIDLPAAGSTKDAATFEPVEGMLVTFSDKLVVSEYFELARYGQIVLTADARPQQFTDAFEPSIPGFATFQADLSAKRIILDDDNNIQNDAITGPSDEPYFWPRPGLSISNLIRGGDSITNLTGVLHWSFAGQSGTDAWRVRPVDGAFNYAFTPESMRPATPVAVGGSLKVASFNVLNYFTTIDNGPDVCGPAFNQDCRGADSAVEFARQREKIVSAMTAINADIIGLMEIENNATAATQDLVDGLNAVYGAGTYAFIDTGTIGTDAIKVALLYNTTTVSPVGSFAILDSSVDVRFDDGKNRPALAQTFAATADGAKLTVVVNHLKSKGSSCVDVGDPDVLDGQGNCNVTRTLAAQAMADWLATDPTGSGDLDFLIIGDLNSYRNEDPIDALEAGSDDLAGTTDDYTDLLDFLVGPSAYTYLFDGQLGYLDHSLANANLLGQVTGVTPWHINADEIPVFDYNDEIDDGSAESSFERESSALTIYEANAYRASDHDPVIVGLELNGPPVCTAAYPVPEALWPINHKFVPVSILGVTDPEGDAVTLTVTSVFQDEPVNGDDDGNTAPDAEGIGTDTAWLRAERDGEGDGRAYHVYFTADDGNMNTCSGEVIVYAPLNKGKYNERVDGGALFDSTVIP